MLTSSWITQNLSWTVLLQFQKNGCVTTFGKGQGFTIGKEYIIAIILDILARDKIKNIEINLTEQIRDNLINKYISGILCHKLFKIIGEWN